MRVKHFLLFNLAILAIACALTVSAASPANFSNAQIDQIWQELYKSGGPNVQQPKIEKLSEQVVIERMTGKWSVMFGATPDKLSVSLTTNHLVTVLKQKDGKDWKKTGEWHVVTDKLVLFLEQDNMPSFIFKVQHGYYIFDPWAKTLMSELKQEK